MVLIMERQPIAKMSPDKVREKVGKLIKLVSPEKMKAYFDDITEKKRQEKLASAHRIDELKDPIHIYG